MVSTSSSNSTDFSSIETNWTDLPSLSSPDYSGTLLHEIPPYVYSQNDFLPEEGESNMTKSYVSQMRKYGLYPPFYDMELCNTLNVVKDPMRLCERPSMILFAMFVVILGVMAIFGNLVLPILVWKQKAMKTKQNFIKVSLAINDMIVGFILLFSVLPNMIWFRNSTESEINKSFMLYHNSAGAIIAVSSLIISLQGSLLHLMYLSLDRYIAIKWPMRNLNRRKSTVIWTLVAIWLVTFVGSAITAALPEYFNFLFNPHVLMYTLGYDKTNNSTLHGYLHFTSALLFPYIATIVLAVLTAYVAFRKLKSFPRKIYTGPSRYDSSNHNGDSCSYGSSTRRGDSRRSDTNGKPELAVVKTIVIMTVAFALAWSIFFVIFFVSTANFTTDAKTRSIVYMVSFYTGMSNSAMNVIIYSLRDDRFRSAFKATFLGKKAEHRWETVTMTRSTVRSTKHILAKDTN